MTYFKMLISFLFDKKMFCRHSFFLTLYTLVLLGFTFQANALVRIDINQGNVDPIPLAIVNFHAKTSEEEKLAIGINDVISNNLETSGLFRIISPDAFLEKPDFIKDPIFSHWRKINSTVLVIGKVEILSSEKMIRVQFKIWDPYAETMIDGMSYKVNQASWRRIAHKISDRIYQSIIGESGYFDSRIVYIAESKDRNKANKTKRLAIMDSDGSNNHFLTDGKDLVLTPRFNPQSQKITYLSYKNGVPQVFILDLHSGVQRLIGNFSGMSFAPRFSADGKSLIMSVAKEGTTAIYEVDLQTYKPRKIIGDIGAISTSPSYSPDGTKIVFNSDRSGSRQLYVMNRDGSEIKRISSGGGVYATPVWSPRGDFIAFTKMQEGKFYIGVMRSDGSGERLLTTSWLEEAPTWSPNGRVIMFYRQSPNGDSKLFAVDITGYHERLIPTATMASDPAWSPLLVN